MLTTVLATLTLPLFAVASFPGSSFGIRWKSYSPYGSSEGELGLVQTSLGKAMTLSDGQRNISAHFTGFFPTGAVLSQICPDGGETAVLVPGEKIDEREVYHFIWANGGAQLPEGSLRTNLVLGPDPTYDTLLTTLSGGVWYNYVEFEGQHVISWVNKTQSENNNVRIDLLKTEVDGINC